MMHVCMYVCMHVCSYVVMWLCMYVVMYVCVCMYVLKHHTKPSIGKYSIAMLHLVISFSIHADTISNRIRLTSSKLS